METLRKSFLIAAFIVSCSFSNAQVFNIDNGHTAITTKVVRFGVVKVVGRFNTVSGKINFDAGNPTKTTANVTVVTDSYSANNPEGENAVKSPAFLDVKKYPEIKFNIKAFTKNSNGFTVTADLTLHGITKEVSFPVFINGPSMDLPTQKQSIGISGLLTINRQDFGINMAAKMPSGGMVIGNEVEIEINALAIAQ